ncbi:protein MEI2-like 3-like isoform X2 [Zea mays]|uniref:Protein MEI2-like 1 n=1 Tax=Zea mays TaxID=4577 RepID=C0PFW8_MAIZE|nr:Protein MEI2-like 3-like [Zea mays]XP_008648116.1 uncharacterized protein LOC100383420 isoform X2 [Zea mays]XP_020394684.1 uncharacterized protein LOC100383420 isoform X2 [Zea mays]XP_035815613.1 uncharacterized protein LOC100383420 isoform X2 [Zea mays]XP_035815614.1 uncharacterized protein LOC100383420 isoform X2 [Zea mays]XP_035815615.1 uncharacterized protein LOC100383420 isoform X2 [Zea mays]XP_035815616.1 uncharacterized protein LOC100383420 isoform X2 [Zea mays]ACN34084.1 unknown [|eukprot:NP_001169543.1 uncharacterized protein LOC100383420 [Zea mays]
MVIASGAVDRGHLSPIAPLSESPSSSSFFSQDLVPTERQVGFWKSSESMVDHKGSKPIFTSPLDKAHPIGSSPAGGLEHQRGQAFKGKLGMLNLGNLVDQQENAPGIPSISWGDVLSTSRSSLGLSTGGTAFVEPPSADQHVQDYGDCFSSSSFTEVFGRKSRLMASGVYGQSAGANDSGYDGDEPLGSMKEMEAQTIGDLLPDDDDLMSGIIDGFEYTGLSNQDDADEDIFYTGGGLELEHDDSNNVDKFRDVSFKIQLSEKHSIDKHHSRALIVKNINPGIEGSDLRALFQQYGDVQTFDTSCKSHGIVTVSYYDIRAAQDAVRAVHNKPLGLMKLDVQFSLPKENVPNKDPNNGTLVVSLIDSSISSHDLLQKFSVYGDVKEIYKSPTSCNKKFVEFYDIRAAQEALNDLNKGEISCSQIKVEHSFSGGAGSCFAEQYSGEQKQNAVAHQLKNSPPGTIGKLDTKSWDSSTVHNLYSPVRPQHDKSQHGFSVNPPQKLSSPIRIESTQQHSNQTAFGEHSGSLGHGNFGGGLQAFHPHSLPECHNGICNGYNSMTLNARNSNFRFTEGIDYNNHKVDHSDLHGHSSDQNEAIRVAGIGSCPLHGHHYTWSNSNGFPQSPSAPMMWPNFQQPVHMHCYPAMPPHIRRSAAHPMDQHHLGSAPNSVGGFANAHSFHPGSLESVGFPGSPQLYPSDLSVFASARGNYRETMFSAISAGFPSIQQILHATNGRNPMMHVSTSYDATNDRIRSRRHDGNAAQSENKKQFELDLDRIAKGEDSRTTLMIKNIPNKYTSKLLLAVIDENHRGTYDFIYLPIDFKNKCNVGYAFINMTDPQQIVPFYKTFNGKKWEKFNSEKVASLAYARIQGRNALIAHFQNSSLMNEEKWCRPMLFHKDGPNAGDQEPFPVGNNVRSRSGRNRPLSSGSETTKEASPSTSPN